jgi:GDPmannose 4,6-dehydratase
MWQMLQASTASDYVLATRQTRSVREFVTAAGRNVGMDIVWRGKGLEEQGIDRKSGRHVVSVDPQFFRPAEVDRLIGNPAKAEKELGWSRSYSFDDLVAEMVEADLRRVRTGET